LREDGLKEIQYSSKGLKTWKRETVGTGKVKGERRWLRGRFAMRGKSRKEKGAKRIRTKTQGGGRGPERGILVKVVAGGEGTF